MNNKDDFWMEEPSESLPVCLKRKRRVGKRTLEFVGWGSKPLVAFLEAIGQDTAKVHSRHDVAAFINKYIKEKSLACAEKKKKIMCDERLYALFGKRTVSRIKVFEMLEEHFAENHDDSDRESSDSSEEENYRKTSSKNYTQMKKVPRTPRSCFAAIVPENIKVLHLKRSLILELLKAPETFEDKIMGSFIRIKSDPNDIYRKNPYQLQRVTGIERVPGTGDAINEIRLKVSKFFNDISIRDLSDDNFTEKEIEDLRDRIKSGMLERLTVSEVELKAEILHADITKHWIAREIALLKSRGDLANEKGWRREFYEYQERRKKLETPSEQEKLLQYIPEVIAEEIEPESIVATSSKKVESDSPPKLIVNYSSDDPLIIVPEGRKKQQTTHGREKLLLKMPEVIAEEAKPEHTVDAGSKEAEPGRMVDAGSEEAEPEHTVDVSSEEAGSACLPKSIVRSISDVSVAIVPETEDVATKVQLNSNSQEGFVQNRDANGSVPVRNSDRHQHAIETPVQVNEMGDEHADLILEDDLTPNGIDEPKLQPLFPDPQEKQGQNSTQTSAPPVIDLTSIPDVQASSSYPQPIASTHNETAELRAQPMHPELAEKANPPENTGRTVADGKKPSQVIELSDDESAHDEPKGNNQNTVTGNTQNRVMAAMGNTQNRARGNNQNTVTAVAGNTQNSVTGNNPNTVLNPYEVTWYYNDPQGQTQGPFALHMLKRWYDANYFPPDFMIWRNGQANSFDAIQLSDALLRAFYPLPYPFPVYQFPAF